MGRNDQSGAVPQVANGEWRNIQLALQRASAMARTTANALDSVLQDQIRMHVLGDEHDPRNRVLSRYQLRVLSLLEIHFRLNLPSPDGVRDLHEGYERIHQRLSNLTRRSFRLVADTVVRRIAGSGGGDVFGYVLSGASNTIYLNETFFSLTRQSARQTRPTPHPIIRPRSGPVRGHATVEQEGVRIIYSLNVRARVILHETVHLCYGAVGAIHRALRFGGNVPTDSDDCNVGYPQITRYMAALNDAYVWDFFAHCVYQARRRYTN